MTHTYTPSSPADAARRAFTLIELLVVIAIISLLMTLAFPALAVMQRLTRGGATETTIGVATRTAAAYAAKPRPNLTYDSHTLRSNGAAILFTPNGDIRILETDRLAFNEATSPSLPLQIMPTPRYGYTDVPNRDYIALPDSAGVVGIVRRNNQLVLLAPPFAVRFDRFGQIATGSGTGEESHMVYYDADYDSIYDTTSKRPPGYNPDTWNSKLNAGVAMDDAGLRPELPFECIETVVGVLMFTMNDLRSEGYDLTASSGYLDPAVIGWLLKTKDDGSLKNARPLFFSRNSGAILKEYR